jgi:arginine N-succinyltransferase
MQIIRPVQRDDLDALLSLAQHTSYGLTTLPRDRALLERRIRHSLRAFATELDEPPAGEQYLMVMEETDTGQIVGTCGVVAKVGGFEPFYAYRLQSRVHESKSLGVRKAIQTLNLDQVHDGPCEIGSLFLEPEARQPGSGRTLSLARFLLIANRPGRFETPLIAEMRGVIDERGASPFWDAIGRHFFDLDLPTADYLTLVNKKFIAELMPEHPIYVPLLPPAAQAVIGQVHDHTTPALRILESEGFHRTAMVDIFEAGPMMQCEQSNVRAIRDSQTAPIKRIESGPFNEPTYLLATTNGTFRAAASLVAFDDEGQLIVPTATARALELEAGQTLRYVALKPRSNTPH